MKNFRLNSPEYLGRKLLKIRNYLGSLNNCHHACDYFRMSDAGRRILGSPFLQSRVVISW